MGTPSKGSDGNDGALIDDLMWVLTEERELVNLSHVTCVRVHRADAAVELVAHGGGAGDGAFRLVRGLSENRAIDALFLIAAGLEARRSVVLFPDDLEG
jgi:hypothetical protein